MRRVPPRPGDTPDPTPASGPPDPGAIRPAAKGRDAGSCRECPVWCERVVYPSGCFESGCPRLYTYEQDGRAYFGCLERVYTVEIDLERFRAAQRTRAGFGALRVSRAPLPMCRCDVETSHPERADGPCVEPDFLLTGLHRPYEVTDAREVGEPSGS